MWRKPICLSLPPPDNVNDLRPLLNELVSGDEIRAERASTLLADSGTDVLPALLDLTHSPDPDSRWWALRTLAQSPLLQADWLIPFLNDPAPEVRQCAALGLGSQPDESAINPLVHALNDNDGMVCNLAVKALITIGRAAVPPLIELAKSSPQSARIHALRALAEIRDHRAIPVMMQVMEEDSALLQYWAKEGLERLGLDMVYLKPV
jgi:HEAT repeat protein